MVYVDKETLESMFGVKGKPSVSQNTQLKSAQYKTECTNTLVNTPGFESEPSKTDNLHDSHAAFKKIERLVKVRDRSVYEVTQRLRKDNYEQEAITSAVDKALRCGYLDDVRFADVLIRSRLRAGKGLSGIVAELKRNGINPEKDLDNFPDAYLRLFPGQKDSAIALLCKKPPRAKNKLQAAYAKLIRSGYPSSLASEAAREWYRMQG
ncbi:MAG: regulatory protein RecX [Eggerthellaceae bacterium]|nr:regulatory protein RecX [Eggerthellaceae bacterium]